MLDSLRIIDAETSLVREKRPEFRRLRFSEERRSIGDTACPHLRRIL